MSQWIARVSRAHIVIVVAGVLAFLSTFAYLQSLDKKIPVAQLSRDVLAGAVITSDDVSFVRVPQDEIIQAQTISESSLAKQNLVARVDLSHDDLLTHSNTTRRSTSSGLQSLSIGVDADRANGGDIAKHDVVDIWETGKNAHLVASGVPVRDVILPNKRLGISTSKAITIVVAVTAVQANELSPVIGSSDIMVVLSTGSPGSTGQANNSPPVDQDNNSFSSIDLNKEAAGK